MATKKISVNVRPDSPDSTNALSVGDDGLFVSKPIFYAGVCDKLGHGLYPTGWRAPQHDAGSKDGYTVRLHPPLKAEGYSVVCSPRIPKDVDLTPTQTNPVKIDPVHVFVHSLEPEYFHIQIVDDQKHEPIEHEFTWILIVPE